MSDIVDGLRGRADRYRQLWGNAAYYTEGNALFDEKAAARIEQLEAALREIVSLDDEPKCCGKGIAGYDSPPECCGDPERGIDRAQSVARAALEERT